MSLVVFLANKGKKLQTIDKNSLNWRIKNSYLKDFRGILRKNDIKSD